MYWSRIRISTLFVTGAGVDVVPGAVKFSLALGDVDAAAGATPRDDIRKILKIEEDLVVVVLVVAVVAGDVGDKRDAPTRIPLSGTCMEFGSGCIGC